MMRRRMKPLLTMLEQMGLQKKMLKELMYPFTALASEISFSNQSF